jgi:hypothetical protein
MEVTKTAPVGRQDHLNVGDANGHLNFS